MDVVDVVGPEREDPAAAEARRRCAAWATVAAFGLALEGLDDRSRARDLRDRSCDADFGQLRRQALPRIGDVVGGDLALGGRVADVDDRAARRPGREARQRGAAAPSRTRHRPRWRGSSVGQLRVAVAAREPPVRVAGPAEAAGRHAGQADHDERRAAPAMAPSQRERASARAARAQSTAPGAHLPPQPPERALTDRLLDVAPRQARDRATSPATSSTARGQLKPGLRRAREHDDRPLPQVDAVGADADPPQRPPAQRPARACSPG